jgi:Domain of unknown function (DUF929)
MGWRPWPAKAAGSRWAKQRLRQAPLPITGIAPLVVVLFSFGLAGQQQIYVPLPPQAEIASIVDAVTHVPAAAFDAAGTGGLDSRLQSAQSPPLTGSSGQPEMLYVGAEFCPFSAAERWSIVVALSRFGSVGGLKLSASSTTDTFPNTPTFTFLDSTYTSSYLDFVSVETKTRSRAPLQTPAPAQQQILNALDPRGSVPFVDIGGRYVGVGAGYSPALFDGQSWADIASSLASARSPAARAILGRANYLGAAMCSVTGDQPGEVCRSEGVAQAKAQLG